MLSVLLTRYDSLTKDVSSREGELRAAVKLFKAEKESLKENERLAEIHGEECDVLRIVGELLRVLEPELNILANSEHYLIIGHFKSRRNRFRLLRWQTKVQLAGP